MYNDGAFAHELRCFVLCCPLLPRVETLVFILNCGRRPQNSEEVAALRTSNTGTGRSASATVRNFSGTMFAATPLAALRLLLLLRRPRKTRIVMVSGCRHIVLCLEQCARVF